MVAAVAPLSVCSADVRLGRHFTGFCGSWSSHRKWAAEMDTDVNS